MGEENSFQAVEEMVASFCYPIVGFDSMNLLLGDIGLDYCHTDH